MADSTEWTFDGYDGERVARTWPNEDARYIAVLCHGYGEHIGPTTSDRGGGPQPRSYRVWGPLPDSGNGVIRPTGRVRPQAALPTSPT